MSAQGSVVEVQDLRKRYKPDVRALDGLSFSAAAGSVFALLGPNGAGKTTTVRILTTLSRPDGGRAEVAGIDVLRKPATVRSAIGVVSQHSGAVGQLTGRENLTMQGRMHGMRAREARRRGGSCCSGSAWRRRPAGRRALIRAGCGGGWTSPPR